MEVAGLQCRHSGDGDHSARSKSQHCRSTGLAHRQIGKMMHSGTGKSGKIYDIEAMMKIRNGVVPGCGCKNKCVVAQCCRGIDRCGPAPHEIGRSSPRDQDIVATLRMAGQHEGIAIHEVGGIGSAGQLVIASDGAAFDAVGVTDKAVEGTGTAPHDIRPATGVAGEQLRIAA